MRKVDAVIVAGKSLEKEIAQFWKSRKFRIFTVPFGAYVHYIKLAKPTVKENVNTVLFFGKICPGKGVGYLIKAEPKISSEVKNFKIIIAGQGFSIYRRLIKNQEHFEIHDCYIKDEELCELFQRACAVALPYYGLKSQSGVLFTAYAFLKPVVVTNVGCPPEAVSHGETGLIIQPNSVEALCNAIITLLKNEKMRRCMKEKIYKRITNEQSWDRIAEIMLDAYHKTIIARK